MKIETAKKVISMSKLKDYQKRYAKKQLEEYKEEIPDDIFFAIIEDANLLEEYVWIPARAVRLEKLYFLPSNWKWYYTEEFSEVCWIQVLDKIEVNGVKLLFFF